MASAGSLTLTFDIPTSITFLNYFELGLYDSSGTLQSLFTTGADRTYTVGAPAAGTYYVGVSAVDSYYYNSDQYSLTVGHMDRGKPGLIAVNSQGRRFVNESDSYHDFVIAMFRSLVTSLLTLHHDRVQVQRKMNFSRLLAPAG